MSKYWKTRIDEQNQAMMDNTEQIMMNKIKSIYLKALEDIKNKVVVATDLRDLSKLSVLRIFIEERINKLGTEEYNIFKTGLQNHVGAFSLTTPNAAEQIVNRIWCSDGKSWSDRIWDDKIKLKNTLVDGLTKIMIEGDSGADLVKALQDQSKFYSTMVNPTFKDIADQGFNQSFNNASRLVRTEITYVHNQCSVERYQEMGLEEYEYVAEMDDRTSEICQELNGKVFKLSDAQPGENLPPMHPNCRSTIVPTVKI